jgi:hypothetical protein
MAATRLSMTLKPVADGGRPVGRVYEGIGPAKSTKGGLKLRLLPNRNFEPEIAIIRNP